VPAIDHESDVPIYLQLAAILRKQIERGELVPRRPVPSKRQLTQEYGIAGGTVDKALAILRSEGLVKTVRGRGIYVTAPDERLRQPNGQRMVQGTNRRACGGNEGLWLELPCAYFCMARISAAAAALRSSAVLAPM
jgi:GntR family transcriptional regulator